MEVHNGEMTSFWFDRWSQLGVLINLTGERGCIDLGIPLNASIKVAVHSYRRRRHRNPFTKQIAQEITRLQELGLSHEQDVCLWKRENDEFKPGFLTSQTWNLIRMHAPQAVWWKGIWFKEATPKYAFLTWLAALNRLSTGDRLLKWNPQATSTCWLCSTAVETRDHLFFECRYSEEVWRGTVKKLVGNGLSAKWSMLMQRLVRGLKDKTSTFLFRYCFQVVVYALWFERNTRRVGEPPKPPTHLIRLLDKSIRNRITALQKTGGRYDKAMEIWFGSR
ncbi:uncharacterized protein LOC108825284 [Raphanus sativus]|uniref:Uncharacterized protein LOC108825284 n=1 Tax=Raphanus sativus TaxID=3726 RepID=A0A6J0L1R3_RAPSA|nr:uncharacterized protein LOC108825284 [Raphanus sativus]